MCKKRYQHFTLNIENADEAFIKWTTKNRLLDRILFTPYNFFLCYRVQKSTQDE